MRRLTRLPGDEEERQQRGISTLDDLSAGDQGANVSAKRTEATFSVPGRDEVQKRSSGVSAPMTITATATPPQPFVGDDVTIAGRLTSGDGEDMVGVPVVLYNMDEPTIKVRTATTTTDSSGRFQFTVTDSVATTHAYIVSAGGRSNYSSVQSTEVLVKYHFLRVRDTTRAALTPATRAPTVFQLAWYELLAIFRDPLKLGAHIKLNDVSITKLLAVVLSLQIALWAVMGLNALGVSIPIVQPLIGFIYLTFVPGILILAALRLRNLDIVEITLYTVGLSVTVVMLIGLVANIVFNTLHIIKPFSFLAVTSSVSFVVLLLCAIAYFRNSTHYRHGPGSGNRWTNPKPLFNTKISVPLAPTLFLCLIPFLAVFSTYLVNTYNVDAGQLALWLILGVVVLLIAFDKVIPSKLYPLAVFVIALSLLFQQTLISAWLTGYDIQSEYYLANSVLNTGVWNPNLLSSFDGLLSIVALAPIYSLISSLNLVWVFKLAYSVICALVPVGLYQVFRRQLNDKVAFLSCFFFMSFATFYGLPTLAREEVAELFFVLLILLLVSKEMNQRIRSALFIVFGLSMVVSHYGVTYIAIGFLFVMWLVLAIAGDDGSKLTYLRTKIGIHKDKQITAPSPTSPPGSLVTIVTISVLFIASTAWYLYTAQGTITQTVVSLGNHIAGSITELFSPTYSEAANAVATGPLPGIVHRVNAWINYLNQFFIVAGLCLVLFLKKQRFKLQFSYVVLSTIALVFLIISVALPYLGAALDFSRVMQIMLIFLAPLLIIGFIKIGETAGVTIGKVTSKLGFGNSGLVSPSRVTKLLAVYLVLFMLFSTGFMFAVTQGYQNIALANNLQGQFTHQDIVGATWVVDNSGTSTIPLSGKPVIIYHYLNNVRYNDVRSLTNSDGQITLNQTFSSTGTYSYYATFPGDVAYSGSTIGDINVNVGSSPATSQATNITTVAQTTTLTLSASNTTPAVGQPVTFTATLTGLPLVYGDYFGRELLTSLAPAQAQNLLPPQNASGFYIFLDTYNTEQNQALVFNYVGVNYQEYDIPVASFISNGSLIYSNGGASVYL
jgi:uncharacterized membrane protein